MVELIQVPELGINFLAAYDMSAILAVKLRKRLGFGMWTNLNLTGMQVEGKPMPISGTRMPSKVASVIDGKVYLIGDSFCHFEDESGSWEAWRKAMMMLDAEGKQVGVERCVKL
ncbi:Uncharacterized protein Rs2_04261 [Raphanus sativus]|nr:Uncharacterized protein Rs2_04261 [Raphanus sativus]